MDPTQNTEHTEKANAAAASGAEISRECSVVEQAHASGKYVIECVGPREEFRAEYVRLVEEAEALLAAGEAIEAARIRSQTKEMEEVKWIDTIDNIVVDVGKNLMLDTGLAGSGYTVTGPYLLLAGGNPASAVAGDTMASKTGWTEVGNANGPQIKYPNSGGTQVRGTCAWSSAATGSKALSSPLSFYVTGITGGATVAGCAVVYGPGAVNTIDSTAGVLYSIGVFTGGSKTVAIGDTLNVSYTASL